MNLQAKKIYFEQVLHNINCFCGKPVDWVFVAVFGVAVVIACCRIIKARNCWLILRCIRRRGRAFGLKGGLAVRVRVLTGGFGLESFLLARRFRSSGCCTCCSRFSRFVLLFVRRIREVPFGFLPGPLLLLGLCGSAPQVFLPVRRYLSRARR